MLVEERKERETEKGGGRKETTKREGRTRRYSVAEPKVKMEHA